LSLGLTSDIITYFKHSDNNSSFSDYTTENS